MNDNTLLGFSKRGFKRNNINIVEGKAYGWTFLVKRTDSWTEINYRFNVQSVSVFTTLFNAHLFFVDFSALLSPWSVQRRQFARSNSHPSSTYNRFPSVISLATFLTASFWSALFYILHRSFASLELKGLNGGSLVFGDPQMSYNWISARVPWE